MTVSFFLVIGLIIGSFLNVVIYRIRSGEGGIINGRSHCRSCKHDLAWYDNIPVVGYVILRGKCRYCKDPIAMQYPLVETATAMLFVMVGMYASGDVMDIVRSMLVALVFASFVVIFVYDLKYMEVPMVAVWIGFALSASAVVVAAYGNPEGFDTSLVVGHVLSAIVAFFFFFAISYVSGERAMGYGDGYIALVIGMLLGPAPTFLALLLAVWIGAIVGIFLMFYHQKSMKTEIPFGPFLVLGVVSVFVIMHTQPEVLHLLW